MPSKTLGASSLQVVELLANMNIKLIAMRCAGYNNVDLNACKGISTAGYNNVDLNACKGISTCSVANLLSVGTLFLAVHGIQVVRVPAYSPYAVAEYAMGLIMTLNRKLHKLPSASLRRFSPFIWLLLSRLHQFLTRFSLLMNYRAYNRTREGNFALQGLLGFDIHGKTVGVVGTGKIGVYVMLSTVP